MTSMISICSNAIVMLGGDPISSFSEPNDHARACSNLYPSVRDTILRAHPWNCATKREIFAPLTTKPPFDFLYQFQLPGDWIRNIQIGRKGESIPFRHEGNRILADVTALPIVYLFRNIDEGTWSTNLIHVMELAMAAKIAYSVTGSISMRDSVREELKTELKIAKAIDGQDDPPEEFEEGTFAESRY